MTTEKVVRFRSLRPSWRKHLKKLNKCLKKTMRNTELKTDEQVRDRLVRVLNRYDPDEVGRLGETLGMQSDDARHQVKAVVAVIEKSRVVGGMRGNRRASLFVLAALDGEHVGASEVDDLKQELQNEVSASKRVGA